MSGTPTITATVPRLALVREEAALSLGVSCDFFDERIRPELRCVRRGRKVLYPVSEIEKWLERTAATALEDDKA